MQNSFSVDCTMIIAPSSVNSVFAGQDRESVASNR